MRQRSQRSQRARHVAVEMSIVGAAEGIVEVLGVRLGGWDECYGLDTGWREAVAQD